MSDDTDDDVPLGQASSRRKIKKRILSSDSSSSSTNNSSPILRTRKNANYRVVSDDSDSDSSDSFSRYSRKRKKVALITSDSGDDSDSSDSIIIRKAKRVANIIESDADDDPDSKCTSSQWETEESDTEEKETTKIKQTVEKDSTTEYDSGGQQSEECPICLVPIRRQELGTPESCDHLFCLACILEWSKNVNTCPIDRQEYRLVFVKDGSSGRIVRRIPIEKPAPPQEPPDDPICCEICGSGDREDRLLLCDGCDLGFHLECLTPALSEVPLDSWYCNVCRSDNGFEGDYSPMRFVMPDEGFMRILRVNMGPRRTDTRLIPRTSQTERVISRILNHRSTTDQATEQVVGHRLEGPSGSSSTTGREQTAYRRTVRRKKNTKKRKRKTARKYRTVYEVDEQTGDVISKKKQVRVRKGRRRTGRNQTRTPKTVKKRLAQQLGICSAQLPNQSLPDVRIPSGNDGLNNQRYQAGIPTLHLFGQRDELDYFSASEEDIAGPGYLVRRRANHSDVAMFRRAARRKGVLLPQTPATSDVADLLGSIMSSQTQLFAKDAKLSVDDSGRFKIEKKGHSRPDLKNSDGLSKKTPYGGGNNRNQRRNNQSYSNPPYPGGSYYPYDSYGPSSTSENYNRSYPNSQTTERNAGGGYDPDVPQDYTQSTLSGYDRDLDSENSQRNEREEDSDIDIYSDIEESVSTSKIDEENAAKPLNLAPASLPTNGSDLENNDSENEMVIDTEKVATPTQDEEEEVKEETAVTSSEDTVVKAQPESETPHSTSEPVQSSFQRGREEEEDEDEDGCPNFNIYSTESINLAKNTDISLNPDQNNQVVSSTPLPEPPIPPPELIGAFGADDVYDPEIVYDPEAAYNSEKESEPPVEDAYDPERAYNPDPEDDIEREYDPERNYDTPEDTCEPETSEEPDCVDIETANDVLVEETKEMVEDQEEFVQDQEETVEREPIRNPSPPPVEQFKSKNVNALYSDSEDEEVVKISQNSFIVGDISTMTEDVSEEERSYTPCLDEKASENRSKGLDDLGTEMISDDEKNDFDESHEHKTASEGDALEINAKESEMDMVKPEDYEEGEIIDKNKASKEKQEETVKEKETEDAAKQDKPDVDKNKTKKKEDKKNEAKQKQESFKKLSKSNKERNYRDKEKGGNRGDKEDKSRNKENSREKRKRKEIERYDVRALIAEKPRRLKDKFGRDIRKSSSKSRSRSYTPKVSPDRRTPPKRRLSADSRERKRKKRSRSRRRSSESRSKSRQRHRSQSRSRRRRSRSRSKRKKKSKDRSKRRKRERSTSRTYTPTRKRRKEWQEGFGRERGFSAEARWTPSLSRSPEVDQGRHMSPSWTPPRTLESTAPDHRGLTVILQNDQNKKKKDKRKKTGKKGREMVEKRTKRKKKDHTPPPSKEVFASGDNILVSVSFNKENERRERDVFTKKKKEAEEKEKKKRSLRRKKKNQELSTVKPVAIIDLERSPFRELTPSPKDIIVLSDEDHVENNAADDAQDVCDSSQQVASPENVPVYMTGPKTPPEPQVKFSLPSKQPALRPLINNPLHDPEDEITHEQEREEEEEDEDGEMRELSDTHKGPNTPPEPPNSPPSSPDAYDPFEPTKSRSPSPDQGKTAPAEDGEKRNELSAEKIAVIPSLTPPLADIQPADSQSSLLISRESSKSPEQVNRSAQPINKSQTLPFAPAANLLTSTPVSTNAGAQRINILSSTILGNVSSTIPQRGIVLPNVKLSPVKNAVKQAAGKGATANAQSNKSNKTSQNGQNESSEAISLDFDSPYSPGSSDYEDLFEPPPEVVTKKTLNKSAPVAPAKDATKPKNAFDSLFDTPVNKLKKIHVSLDKSTKGKKSKGTKIVGVKLDEDHLKILDELPNSAVEMQVKDKFLKKLNRQERVVEEVKLVLKPYYNKKKIDKEEYKDIMRRAVPKICHNKSGEINPTRIKNLIEAYVKKIRHSKKVTSSSSYNPLKG
ncbi:uncharacterized protein LOC123318198 [Coccinella septempunctata]|uniref:uncharacterized protein LOC123318198 n=1 Tax=Coccinella septempunctata TaxID=41139 RepID=UPI001D06CD04|nr:uncharacterized protein LOC123318198 [Coccinella septempunctata]